MKVAGIFLIAISVIFIVYALNMKTSTPFILGGEIEVPDLVQQRNTYIILSVFGIVGGFLLLLIGILRKGKFISYNDK